MSTRQNQVDRQGILSEIKNLIICNIQKAESIRSKKIHIILRDFQTQLDLLIPVRKANIELIRKKKNLLFSRFCRPG